MPENSSSPILRRGPLVVATISHPTEWILAREIHAGVDCAPDLLEVRADLLLQHSAELPGPIRDLPLPVILTVRHPSEGGQGPLDSADRLTIYRKYAKEVAAIDLELAFAAEFSTLIEESRTRGQACIFSYHHFTGTPSYEELEKKTRKAIACGADVFKVAVTTDHNSQLSTLLQWLDTPPPLPVAAMGMGRLGKISRPLLAQLGSQLNYGYVSMPLVSGQWSANELKKIIQSIIPNLPE